MPTNQTITINAAENNGRWIVFKVDIDLSQYEPSAIKTWQFETRPYNAGTKRKVLGKIKTQPGSVSFDDDYDRAFAEVHCVAFTTPDGVRHDEPTSADIDALNPLILPIYVFRAGMNSSFTDEDLESIKKKGTTEPSDSGS